LRTRLGAVLAVARAAWKWMLILAVGGCIRAIPPSLAPASQLTYRTTDGWMGAIRHFPGEGPPVLLVHGMGANHYNWDYHPDVSLAHHLQQEGWDVWVPELRGDPGSVPPHPKARGGIAFDDYATKDLPRIVDAVLGATGEPGLFYVGHSMGGMLLYTSLAQFPEKIRAGVAISSPSAFQHPLKIYGLGRVLGWTLGGQGRLHFEGAARLAAPLGKSNLLVARLGNRKNLDWGIVKGMSKVALTDLPKPLVRQALSWVKSGELTTVDGKLWLRPASTPLLVMCGVKDKVVSERDVAGTCERFENCTYQQLSVSQGFSFDYGHIDPVMGRMAKSEVYPLVSDFLDAHRGD
jgi:polyhydroxyalkanoate synthase subunit PhaC